MRINTRCIIVDDEPLAINLIRSHLNKIESIDIVGECRSAIQALEILRNQEVDLMFLDINMPKITGLEFLRTLTHPPYVIITTAYREYALEGFELNVVDYLLKPISFDRFLKSINRYYDRHDSSGNHPLKGKDRVENDFIYIQDGKTVHKLFISEIFFIEGCGEYVKINTGRKKIVARITMTEMELRLNERGFLRIHKSYIISLNKISSFTVKTVNINGETLPIGRNYKGELLANLEYKDRLGKTGPSK